jgi:hypothetical protein
MSTLSTEESAPTVSYSADIPACGAVREDHLFGYLTENAEHCYDFRMSYEPESVAPVRRGERRRNQGLMSAVGRFSCIPGTDLTLFMYACDLPEDGAGQRPIVFNIFSWVSFLGSDNLMCRLNRGASGFKVRSQALIIALRSTPWANT